MIPVFQWVEIEKVRQVARATYLLSYSEPESASKLEPGQFCMISASPHTSDLFLPRPFSYYRVTGNKTIQVLFRTVGRATRWMAGLAPQDRIGVFGPLGNTFTISSGVKRAILVAGGIGLPPLVMLAVRLAAVDQPPVIDLIYGEQTGDLVVNLKDDLPEGVNLHLCSEDGAVGRKALVTEPLAGLLNNSDSPPAVYTCGPNLMMGAVARMLNPERVALFEASTEENMACGRGICKGCVVPMAVSDGSVSYRYCCTDGPVFNGFEVKWPQS